MAIKRIGQVIGIKPEDIEEYEKLHANAWPSIIEAKDNEWWHEINENFHVD